MDVSMCFMSCSFREGINDSPSDQPKLWAICLKGSGLSRHVTSHYRLRLSMLESCLVISYHSTDDWSVFNTRSSSTSFSHILTTYQLNLHNNCIVNSMSLRMQHLHMPYIDACPTWTTFVMIVNENNMLK